MANPVAPSSHQQQPQGPPRRSFYLILLFELSFFPSLLHLSKQHPSFYRTHRNMSTLLHYNVSLTWPDPVLDFYPLELWSPQAHTTSSGTWSSAQNSGSGTLSGVYLAHFNASSVAVTGTSQWSNMRYNASLTPDGPADNVVVQDVGEDITYGFHSGNVLFEQGDLVRVAIHVLRRGAGRSGTGPS